MPDEPNQLAVWTPKDTVEIPSSADTPTEIVKYAVPTLTKRDMQAIVAGFHAEGYEMVSTFVWTKAAAILKKQVATLGMEFVGEMLGRPDLDDDSDPTSAIGDHEAISLAEDLGMITATQALRLKHSMQLVNHFAALAPDDQNNEEMEKSEAVSLLKSCITSILGKPSFEAAVRFADFRRSLTERRLEANDGDVLAIKGSPYFFIRTTLSVLLSSVKTAKGALKEHAVGNSTVLIPALWERFRGPEKWQIGQAYAEVNAAGNKLASAGLKKALLAVQGFDFVPETLRSNTFTETAAKVLSAHFAMNNFYNELDPMEALASLGTSIPMPAFAKCLEATLAVKLGNCWGHAYAAQLPADRVLKSITPTKWHYYFNECLPRDKTVLDKISEDDKPTQRWCGLVREFLPRDLIAQTPQLDRLLKASLEGNTSKVNRIAETVRTKQAN